MIFKPLIIVVSYALSIGRISWLLFVLLAGAAGLVPAQQPPPGQAPLTIEALIGLIKTGVSEEAIVARIKRNAKAFDLSPEEVTELRRDGVSDTIFKYLFDPSLPYTPPPPPPPPPAAAAKPPPPPPPLPKKKYPEDKLASKVPPEPGVYFLDEDGFTTVELKTLLPAKSGGLGQTVTAGLLKAKIMAQLLGRKAKTRAKSPPVFYIRLDVKIEEIALVVLSVKEDRRELEMAGEEKKPTLKVESMKPYDPVEVDAKLFRVIIPPMKKGEYCFYLMGSADPPKGIQGKGYDFGVE